MEVIEKKQNGIYILTLPGRLDGHTCEEFRAKVLEIIEAGRPNIILDCEGLKYIASAGLAALLYAAKQTKRSGGKIVFCSVNDYLKESLEASGFEPFLTIVSSPKNALEEF
jgi:anti-anti-sigma factor